MHRVGSRLRTAAATLAAGLATGCGSPPAAAGFAATPSGTAAPAAATSAAAAAAVATSTTAAAAAATAAPLPCSSAPVERTVAGAPGTARVLDVAAASHESAGYDRFVLHLSGVPSSYRVVTQGTPDFFEDASGRPVTLEGTAGVRISLRGLAGTPAYAGPTDLHPGLAQLREARQIGIFEGVVSWGIGLAGTGCIRVLPPTAASPTQLVVDIATG